ncbi:MAG: 7-carboxy-7-deazaguanine synthase QueE [Candidatus Heimdallarchaeota archaeon]
MTEVLAGERKQQSPVKGNLIEIFSSFQGEGGVVRGSCFGRRQIFVRLAGCNLHCIWCDTASSRDVNAPTCRVETVPGSWKFTTTANPVTVDFTIEQILNLSTKDLHSVSLTGGEPTFQEEFFYELTNKLYELEIPIYLETNGYYPQRIEKVAPLISYACVDIKDRSANSVKKGNWEKLVERELTSLSILNNFPAKVFAKLVVTEDTNLNDVQMIANKLREIVIPIVVQPATPLGGAKAPSAQKLFQITETLAETLPTDLFGLSIQGHKLLKLL